MLCKSCFLREKVAKLTHLSERPPKRTWSPPQLRRGPSSHAALPLRAGFGTFLTIPGPPYQAPPFQALPCQTPHFRPLTISGPPHQAPIPVSNPPS